MLRPIALLALTAAWSAIPASAQLPGQGSLNGVYNVRYLGVYLLDANGNPADIPLSFSGTFTFNGTDTFTVSGQGTSSGKPLSFRPTGQYTVLPSGQLVFDNPFDPTANDTFLYGGLAKNGVVTASSTESFYCDHLIAIPAATTASASTLNGTYRVAHLEFLSGDVFAGSRNTFFTMSANGSGSLGNVTIQGTAQSLNNAATTQTSVGATYTMTANGSGTMVLPAPSGVSAANTLLSGSKTLYLSADGNFFIAGSSSAYDLIVGVKTGGTTVNGLYWLSYLNNYDSSGDSEIIGVAGSANTDGTSGNQIAHERTNDEFYYPYDFTYYQTFTFNSNGVLDDSASDSFPSLYGVGANGDIVIGAGASYNYMVEVYLKAPTLSGTGVFLNPQGIVNAATFAPVTTQVAPGEMITLFGTGMGPTTPVAAAAPFPTTLGNVQVLINNVAAPLYVVSAGQITTIVPFNAVTTGQLSIQVIYNGNKSNVAQVWAGFSSPGLYTTGQNGIGVGDVTHADGSLVSTSSPAKVGETVVMYLNGLGAVTGNVNAGDPAPSNPLANVVEPVMITIGGVQANVVFQGLAPGFAGLYQLNVTIPSGLTKGDYYIGVFTFTDNGNIGDSINSSATMSIAGS
jgi:uncharacterized protein (TIGR03437 family)